MKPKMLFATHDEQLRQRVQAEVADLCRMTTAINSGQAYQRLLGETYQVAVIDSKLPQLTSVELAHALWHSPNTEGVLVSWGPLNDVVYVREVKNWEHLIVPRSFKQLVGTLRARLDPEAARTLADVRYERTEDAFFVAFRSGKTYELSRKAIEADDGSPLVGPPRIIDGGEAFEVRQASGNTYQVPWDAVLYHQQPGYPNHKGRTEQREREARSAERIAFRVRREREARGWSLGELCRRTGMQPPNLSRLESGKHMPSLETVERLAAAFGLRVADLLTS